MKSKTVGAAILKEFKCRIGNTAPSVASLRSLLPCQERSERSRPRRAQTDEQQRIRTGPQDQSIELQVGKVDAGGSPIAEQTIPSVLGPTRLLDQGDRTPIDLCGRQIIGGPPYHSIAGSSRTGPTLFSLYTNVPARKFTAPLFQSKALLDPSSARFTICTTFLSRSQPISALRDVARLWAF